MTRRCVRIPPGLLAVVLSVICLAGSPAAQAPPLAGLDDLVVRAMKDWRIPGLALAVAKDGKIVLQRGYGVRQIGQPALVDTHTLFAIGSTTKAMTAALVGMLVDDKLLGWDDPVVKHLPWFQLKDPAVTRELTVRDLLTHRGGLGNADYLWYGQSNSTEEILKRVRLIEPAYSVRSSFIYQNIMFAAAGGVIEAAGRKPWAEAIRQRIFEPLGMRDSIATAATLAAQSNVAAPHDIVRGHVRVIENMSVDPVASAGAVWSSVSDMAKWMQFLLDGGRVGGSGGKRLIGETTFAELFKPQTIAPFDMYPTTSIVKPHWMTYALGWFQQDYRGRAVDFHTGSIDGMIAIHGLIRDDRLGVYALANLDHAELRHALMYTVFDRYTGAPERDWSTELLKLYTGIKRQADETREKEEAKRVRGTAPSLPLAEYAGTCSDPLRGDVNVTLINGGLRLHYGPGFVGPLEHWHYNTFRAKWTAEWHAPALVTFALDAAGKPTYVELMGGRFTRTVTQQPSGVKRIDSATAGRLVGRAVFRGTPPPREVLDMSIDPVCVREAGPNAESESVLIDRSGGLQNVFVYLKDGLDPGYTFDAPMTPTALDQRRCQFSPRVLGVRVGQVLEINNGDPTLHNVHGKPRANQEFNVGQPIQGMRFSRTFTAPEVMVPLTSDVHGWMAAFVGVLPHPFFAVTSPDGSFTITGVPPGSYTIEAWHEKFGRATQSVAVGPRQTATLSLEFPAR